MSYKSILLFGPPGSGKGTQGKVVGSILGFVHVSTGDLFRALDKQSELGKLFAEYSSKGQLVPDDFTIKLLIESMANRAKAGKLSPASDILVLDGVPRNVNQAKLLADKIDVLKVVCLSVSDMDEMVKRLKARAIKENRADDADEKVIRNRMDVYNKETKPILDFYPQDKIVNIDALQTPIHVLGDIIKVLTPLRDAIDNPKAKSGGCGCCCG